MIKGQIAPRYGPTQRRARERALLRQANELLSANRRRRRQARSVDKKPATESAATTPRRYTLANLGLLRRRGLVP